MLKYLKFIKDHDPSAHTYLDIILFCPSVWIMFWYRISHFLYKMRFTFLALLIMNFVRIIFSVDIHPKAQIGKNFFIDHGIGTVIGETTIIGNNCIIYHNVTLGSVNNTKEKRHPTIGDDVMIGTGAVILGNIVIGNNSKIGASSIILKDVPQNTTVVGLYK